MPINIEHKVALKITEDLFDDDYLCLIEEYKFTKENGEYIKSNIGCCGVIAKTLKCRNRKNL